MLHGGTEVVATSVDAGNRLLRGQGPDAMGLQGMHGGLHCVRGGWNLGGVKLFSVSQGHVSSRGGRGWCVPIPLGTLSVALYCTSSCFRQPEFFLVNLTLSPSQVTHHAK
jgi:hypothetical protein